MRCVFSFLREVRRLAKRDRTWSRFAVTSTSVSKSSTCVQRHWRANSSRWILVRIPLGPIPSLSSHPRYSLTMLRLRRKLESQTALLAKKGTLTWCRFAFSWQDPSSLQAGWISIHPVCLGMVQRAHVAQHSLILSLWCLEVE